MKQFAVLLALLALFCAGSALAQTHVYPLKARPFGVGYADDGHLFVAMMGRGTKDSPNGIAAFETAADDVKQVGFVATPGEPGDMARTHDGKLIVIAAQARVVFIDAERLLAGGEGALLGDFNTDGANSSITAAVSNDDHWLFVAEEQDARITVIDLARVRASGFKDKAIVGHIPVGAGPVGMAMSADGRYLYATTELADGALACPPEAGSLQRRPRGELDVIDVAAAGAAPKKAIVARAEAGCDPVRVVLSGDGQTAFVTARGDNEVLAFATQGLRLLGEVGVGPAPVGMTLSHDGQTLFVADSDRFAGAAAHPQLAVVDVRQAAQGRMRVSRSLSVGRFPREMAASPDGEYLALGDFGAGDLLLMKLSDLVAPASPSP